MLHEPLRAVGRQSTLLHAVQHGGVSCMGVSGIPKDMGEKIRIGGWKCYITPAFLGIPNKGDKVKRKKRQKKQKQKFPHGVPCSAYNFAD